MKKIIWSLLSILFLGVACTDELDVTVAPPQTNPEESPITIAIQADNAATAYNMADIQTNNVAIAKISSISLVEGASVAYEILVTKTGDDSVDKLIYSASADGNTINLPTQDLRAAVENFYGKRPVARDLSFVVDAYVTSSGQTFHIRSNTLKVAVTLTAPVIESAYYLIGNVNGWSFDNLDAYKFSHSDKDVYDDPIFTLKVYMSGADKYFKIIPQSSKVAGSWDGAIGNPVDGNTALTGTLIIDNSQAMRVMEDGWVNISLNMMDYTYTIELLGNAQAELYVPGGHQGWSPETAPIVYSPNLDWKFDGYVYMEANNAFKFTAERNWSGTNYGDGGNGTLSTANDAGNLTVSETGFYRLTADLSKEPNTYTVTATEWGLIGDATPGGWDASTPLELNPATGEWSVTTTLVGGKAFKFRANNGWDINLGGDLNNLTYGGDNIPVAADGTYKITLKLGNASAYTCNIAGGK
ncbi:hypothetical protein FACS189446_0500 [Bacteroidia bacterium]|nr:hypothetical protein FACS189446_0500 [Bacteroidia bacterium]